MNTSQPPENLDLILLQKWLGECGVGHQFIGFSGETHAIPLASQWQILQAMGQAPASAEDLQERLRLADSKRHAGLPAVLLIAPGAPQIRVWFRPDQLDLSCSWELAVEQGEVLRGQDIPLHWAEIDSWTSAAEPDAANRSHSARVLKLPAVDHGYHALTIRHGENTWQSLLIAAPEQAWRPDKLLQAERCRGISVQLYTVRSADNCGMGDFKDLQQLLGLCGEQGIDFIQLNPLHALDPRYPENASPYSPGDRRFLNPLYISPVLCPGFSSPRVQTCWQSPEFQKQLQAARQSDQVRYSDVSQLKYRIFAELYQWLMTSVTQDDELHAELQAFVASSGEQLQQYSRYQASHAEAGTVMAEHGFQIYLQWLAERQLQACQQLALDSGMALGLLRDLAVGSIADGCEVESNPGQFCLDARIGAPPDNFNPDGQNWGLPPMLPASMVNDRFQLFRTLVSRNMSNCGALRVDHVLGFYRLWWCPNDGSNATGAYVHYPAALLFAILRLESHRQQCVVIGEDLGVVPPEIREYLDNGGIYSNCVFYFEKYDDWHYRKPEHYKWQALTMQANHDVAPLTSWWNASDLHLRLALGLIPDAAKLEQELQWRRSERGSLLQWLDELGLLPGSWQSRPLDNKLDDELQLALTRAFARINSALLCVQLDDLAQLELPVNIPGTSAEYANWRRKLPVDLEAIFSRPVVRHLLKAFNEVLQ